MPDSSLIRGIQGDDWHALGWQWSDSDDVAVPIVSARMSFKADIDDATAIVELTEESGIDPDGLATGIVDPELTPEQTRLLSTGVYDVEATSDGGQVETLAIGDYIFKEDVSR